MVSVLILALAGASAKIMMLNHNAHKPVIEDYSMGGFVALEDNFHTYANYSANGYELNAISAEVLTCEQFYEKHRLEPEDIPQNEDTILPAYVYELNLIIRNTAADEEDSGGIDLIGTRLYSSSDTFQLSDELFGSLYPQLYEAAGLKLRGNTEMQFYFP